MLPVRAASMHPSGNPTSLSVSCHTRCAVSISSTCLATDHCLRSGPMYRTDGYSWARTALALSWISGSVAQKTRGLEPIIHETKGTSASWFGSIVSATKCLGRFLGTTGQNFNVSKSTSYMLWSFSISLLILGRFHIILLMMGYFPESWTSIGSSVTSGQFSPFVGVAMQFLADWHESHNSSALPRREFRMVLYLLRGCNRKMRMFWNQAAKSWARYAPAHHNQFKTQVSCLLVSSVESTLSWSPPSPRANKSTLAILPNGMPTTIQLASEALSLAVIESPQTGIL